MLDLEAAKEVGVVHVQRCPPSKTCDVAVWHIPIEREDGDRAHHSHDVTCPLMAPASRSCVEGGEVTTQVAAAPWNQSR